VNGVVLITNFVSFNRILSSSFPSLILSISSPSRALSRSLCLCLSVCLSPSLYLSIYLFFSRDTVVVLGDAFAALSSSGVSFGSWIGFFARVIGRLLLNSTLDLRYVRDILNRLQLCLSGCHTALCSRVSRCVLICVPSYFCALCRTNVWYCSRVGFFALRPEMKKRRIIYWQGW